ncbi:Ig-like domain repeat protein [Jatrophihabitans sp. DSM 45814]
MKLSRRWATAALTGVVGLTTAIVVTATGAHAAPGTVDPAVTGDANAQGTLSIYDSNGDQISSGSLDDLGGNYFMASSATARVGTTKASLFAASPDHTKADSSLWNAAGLTAASNWPLTTAAGAPANLVALEGAGVPVVHVGAGDGSLAGFFAGSVNDPTAGFDHIVQIRLEDSGPGKPAQIPFWQADVLIDTVANTWTQLFPTPPPAKTVTSLTAITASPVSPAVHGSTVTLTSTLSAADSSSPAGTVQLFDGATAVGAATFTAATGAVSKTVTPTDGAHNYKFVFTPTDTATYSGASSAVLSYTVNAVTQTTTALTASPAGLAVVGDSVELTATVTPANAVGTVKFLDGATMIGSAMPVSAGTATTSTTTLTLGNHQLTAVFVPTDSAVFATSPPSPVVAYEIDPLPANPTTTTLAVTPAGPITQGDNVTLDATVSPTSAVGSVNFFNGAVQLGSSPVVAGAASFSPTSLPVGTLSLVAKFVPSDSTLFGASSSSAVPLVVKAPAITPVVTVTSSPVSPIVTDTDVTFTATFNPTVATGTVQFSDGSTPIGSPVTVTDGTATVTTSFSTAATHSITAAFTSSDLTVFKDAISAPLSVNSIPPATATAVSLAVSPTSPVDPGTSVTLTATVTPADAVGSVVFTDGATATGSPATVTNGTAAITVSTLGSGVHSLSAAFTATDVHNFTNSATTSPTPFTVNATATTIALAATPADLVSLGSPVKLKATVSPAGAVGGVQFLDGQTVIGSAPVVAGSATFSTSSLTEDTHTLTAVFAPTDVAKFGASTSSAVTLTVKADAMMGDATGSDGQILTPGMTLKPGQVITLAASGFVPNETVTEVVHSAPVTIGTTHADASGNVTTTITLPTNLAPGNHTLVLQGSLDAPSFAFVIAAVTTPVGSTPTDSAAAAGDPGSDSSGGLLASTGTKVIPAAVLALLLIGGGFVLLTGGRRRRSNER